MRVEREPEVKKFKPFTIVVRIDEANDAQLLRGLFRKLEDEVKAGGIYHGIVQQFQLALGE